MVDTTSDGREYLIDYNFPGVIGPLEHRHAGMYCGSRLNWGGKEHQLHFSEGKIFGIFPSDDILVEGEDVVEDVQVDVAVLSASRL